MTLPITTALTSLLALLLFRLSLHVIKLRRRNKVSLGDGGNKDLRRAIRGQANCAEYAPIAVLLVLVAEFQSANSILLVVLAAAFLLGRLLHGYAFAFIGSNTPLRVRGMQLTFLAMVALAVLNLGMLAVDLIAPGGV